MGRPTPETGGGAPHNHGLSEFKVLRERQGLGPRIPKPEVPKQQQNNAEIEVYKQLREKRWGTTVFEGPLRVPRPLPQKPSEHRGEAEPFQPNPAEQQAAERLGKPPPQEEIVETLDPEIEVAIREYGLAIEDPEKEAKLRESAKKFRSVRDSLVNPGFGLVVIVTT